MPAPDLLEADATDAAALAEGRGGRRVVVTTVGPYALYGEPLVAACAAAGTDYVDLTGEPEFVDRMWIEHHAEAERTGARIVHCCGFDSIPHDLGAYFTVQQLPEGVPLKVNGYVRSNASFSGGTYALGDQRLRPRPADDRRRQGAPPRRAARGRAGRSTRPRRPSAATPSSAAGSCRCRRSTAPIVRRSAAALDRYGPDFTYGHHVVARHLSTIAAVSAGVGAARPAGAAAADPQAAAEDQIAGRGARRGRGASAAGSGSRFVGEGGGKRVVTEVSGGDPGYGETSKMLAESGLCLAFDELPPSAGQVTTAVAMGDALLARLQRAGIAFRVLEPAEA